jgi:CRP-like cAMP-binding protein
MDTPHKYLQPDYLRKITIFSSLNDADLEIIINAPENGIEEYKNKDVIFHEEEIGNCMYIILEGSVDVFIKGSLDYRDATIATLRAGDYFGESAVLTGGEIRRNASVRAESPSKIFRIDKKHILNAINKIPGNTEISARFPPDEVRDIIMEMPMFSSLNYDELLNINDWTSIESYKENDFIFRQGEPADNMFIILEGFVEMLALNNDEKYVFFETRKPVDYIGVTPLLPGQDDKYKFSVKTCSETRVIKIPKDFFKQLLNRDIKLAKHLKNIHIVKKMKLGKIMSGNNQEE